MPGTFKTAALLGERGAGTATVMVVSWRGNPPSPSLRLDMSVPTPPPSILHTSRVAAAVSVYAEKSFGTDSTWHRFHLAPKIVGARLKRFTFRYESQV